MTVLRKLTSLILSFLILPVVFTGCRVRDESIPVSKITITLSGSRDVKLGESVEFTVKFTPENATDKEVDFYFDGDDQDLGIFEESHEPNVYFYIPNEKAAQQNEGKVTFFAESKKEHVRGKKTVTVKSTIVERIIYLKESDGTLISTLTVTSNKIVPSLIDKPEDTSSGKFGGWYLNSDCTIPVDFNSTLNLENVFYAKRVAPATRFTVTFDAGSQCSSNPDSVTVEVGTSITLPQNLSSATHTFLGWTESEGSEQILGSTYIVNSNITLYAKWKSNAVEVIHVESVTIGRVETEQVIGNKIQLAVNVFPDDADNKSVSYSTSNSTVATVSSTGLVTFKSAGNVRITVTSVDGGKSDYINFQVEDVIAQLESIAISGISSIKEGGSTKLNVTYSPSNISLESKAVTWKSSDTNVATVSADGTVKGIAEGKATITCTSNVNSSVSAVWIMDVTAEVKDKIIVHCAKDLNFTNIYAWVDGGQKFCGEWPGKSMTLNGSWYDYTLETTSCNLIFTNNDGSSQTKNLSREAGEWWYYKNEWYPSNPEDTEAPVITSEFIPSGSITGTMIVAISASDNSRLSKAELFANDVLVAAESLEGTNCNVNINFDSEYLKNGTYTIYVVVYDAGGNSVKSSSAVIDVANANSAPEAVITGNAKPVAGKTAKYSAANSYDKNGDELTYAWTVTGATIAGGQGTMEITVKVPESVGSTYTVKCSVSDGQESAVSNIISATTIEMMESRDFREESIYFLMTTRFFDGDSSNNIHSDHDAEVNNGDDDPAFRGDFKGLIQKLDYIKSLGFSAIWITPVVENASGYDFHGYHSVNFKKVDPRLESPGATFDDLIAAVHSKGMKLILDIVLQHTSNSGEETLFPIVDRTYTLNQGVTGNKVVTTPKPSANSDLNRFMKTISKGAYSDYMAALADTKNGPSWQYQCRDQWMKEADMIYRKNVSIGWEDFTVTTGQFAGDCMELNTELPQVYNYMVEVYNSFIERGVDAFRIDTVKHISRLTMNEVFAPAFKQKAAELGNDNFYMYAEVACRTNEFINHGRIQVSPLYYTWKPSKSYPWNHSSADGKDNLALCQKEFDDHERYDYTTHKKNHFLNGNNYSPVDNSEKSDLNVIDYGMHFNFKNAGEAFRTGKAEDNYFNDSTYNVVYVDSHDYGPAVEGRNDQDGNDLWRYEGGTNNWAENITLMWTFRGIPCLYYGSEVEFKKGLRIDKYNDALENTGRAYFGDHITGNVTASDFGTYSSASGNVKTTLESKLSQHIRRMNIIRRKVPALQKGQYSTDNCSGNMCFKRRYTDENTDSFALVTISGDATFNGIPGGKYVDVVTGDTKTVAEGGSLSTSGCTGSGNARIYVLQNETASIYGATEVLGAETGDTFLK